MTVGCDLFLDLKLYRVPEALLQRLHSEFPSVRFVEVNTGSPSAGPIEDVEVYWGNRITGQLIAAMPKLKWIHFGSVGVNRADVPAVRDRGIVVTNSRGASAASVAASAVAFMCALARGLHIAVSLRRQSDLSRERFDDVFEQIRDLDGDVCVIVGCGEAGRRVSRACAGLGMHTIAVKAHPETPCPHAEETYGPDRLPEAVERADFVINLLPLTRASERLFDATLIGRLKPSAYFINVGRGETVDESALIQALQAGRIAGAGLDVFAREPLPSESPLWALDNVLLTPHVAGIGPAYWRTAGDLLVENLRRYLAGQPLLNVVDPSKGS